MLSKVIRSLLPLLLWESMYKQGSSCWWAKVLCLPRLAGFNGPETEAGVLLDGQGYGKVLAQVLFTMCLISYPTTHYLCFISGQLSDSPFSFSENVICWLSFSFFFFFYMYHLSYSSFEDFIHQYCSYTISTPPSPSDSSCIPHIVSQIHDLFFNFI